MNVRSRVTDSEIETHTREIGVVKPLKKTMLETLRRFVQFVRSLGRLHVVELEGFLSGHSLFGNETIVVRDCSN